MIKKALQVSPDHKKLKHENSIKGSILNEKAKGAIKLSLQDFKYETMPLKTLRPKTTQNFIGDSLKATTTNSSNKNNQLS